MAEQKQLTEGMAIEQLLVTFKAECGCMLYEKNGKLEEFWFNMTTLQAIGMLELIKHRFLTAESSGYSSGEL